MNKFKILLSGMFAGKHLGGDGSGSQEHPPE